MCPKYSNCCRQMKHFFGAKNREYSTSLFNMARKWLKCSSNVFENTITSSKYTRQLCHFSPASTTSIILWNVAGALHSPNGITLNCHSPAGEIKAVFSLSSSRNGICQYPHFRSNVEKCFAPSRAASKSSMRGRGYTSFFVTAFSLR